MTMGWLDFLWLSMAGACSTFALTHGVVWWRRRDARLNGTYALIAIVTASLTLIEPRLLASKTVADYEFWFYIYLIPLWALLLGILLFTRQYLSGARHWIGWLAIGLRTVAMVIIEVGPSSWLPVRVVEIEQHEFWGQWLAVVTTRPGPLAGTMQLSMLLFVAYIVDATIGAWRAGIRQRARYAGLVALLLIVSATWTYFSLWNSAGFPVAIVPVFVPIVLLLGVDLSANLIRARDLESQLRTSERQLSLAAEAAHAGLWMIEPVSGEIWLTPRCRELFELPAIEGMRFSQALPLVHPEDRLRFRRMFVDEFDAPLSRAAIEFRVVRANGEVRWYSSHGQRVARVGERGPMLMGATIDITDRKRAEEERLHRAEQLERLGRLAITDELAATVAHELNQPLASIMSNAETALMLLSCDTPEVAEARTILAEIVAADERAAAIIRRLRGHLKHHEPMLQPVALRDAVSGVLAFMRVTLQRRGVQWQWEAGSAPHLAYCDPVRFDQVLINLITNACDAMSESPASERKLTITLVRDAAFEVVRVTDMGPGLKGDVDNMFEPFYTTKSDGLGLGLSIAKSIVEAHGGKLWVQRSEERGVTFAFSMPIFEGAPA